MYYLYSVVIIVSKLLIWWESNSAGGDQLGLANWLLQEVIHTAVYWALCLHAHEQIHGHMSTFMVIWISYARTHKQNGSCVGIKEQD